MVAAALVAIFKPPQTDILTKSVEGTGFVSLASTLSDIPEAANEQTSCNMNLRQAQRALADLMAKCQEAHVQLPIVSVFASADCILVDQE